MALEKGNTENDEKKDLVISPEQLNELIDRAVEAKIDSKPKINEISNIEKILKTIKESTSDKSINSTGYTRVEDIDPKDVLPEDEYITFFSPFTGYAIVDDKRKSHMVKLPFGKESIMFEYQWTKQRPQGKEIELINLSKYVCTSKREAEWLKQHSMYGVKFFVDTKKSINSDMQKMSKVAKYITVLEKMGQSQIMNMYRAMGNEPISDVHAMKIAIASERADAEIKQDRRSEEMVLRNKKKEDLFTE